MNLPIERHPIWNSKGVFADYRRPDQWVALAIPIDQDDDDDDYDVVIRRSIHEILSFIRHQILTSKHWTTAYLYPPTRDDDDVYWAYYPSMSDNGLEKHKFSISGECELID